MGRPLHIRAPLAARNTPSDCFPGMLSLRRAGDRPLGNMSKPGEAFVLPLDVQGSVQKCARGCSAQKVEVSGGMHFTAWAVSSDEDSNSASLLEPLVAYRSGRSLAVDLVELVMECCTGLENGAASSDVELADKTPLRYGECFRLRAADTGLYLCHDANENGLRWQRCDSKRVAELVGSRFAAHGSELGAPLILGRPFSLQCVASPAPPSDSDSECDSDSASSDSELDALLRGASGGGRSRSRMKASELVESAGCEVAESLVPDSSQALFSRLADTSSVFSVMFLPVDTPRTLGQHGGASRATAEVLCLDDEREMHNMDGIVAELNREMKEECEAVQQRRTATEQSNQRIAVLENRIAPGEKLLQATRDVVIKRNAQAKPCD